jgi:hypothetical protein
MSAKYFKVIACEIAFREFCYVAAHARNVIDLEFLTQGLHDNPSAGCQQIQQHIDAVPEGKYDAILVGYALCGNIVSGLRSTHTPLVIPRVHDCITFFLGSRDRYEEMSKSYPGAYFYTSGWLECLRRRGTRTAPVDSFFLPTRAGASDSSEGTFEEWIKKYGEEKARYLMSVMDHWTQSYTHGVLIEFPFTKPLHLRDQVMAICVKRGWQYEEVDGDLSLFQHWLDGEWFPEDFLVVQPGQQVSPSYKEDVIETAPAFSEKTT